MKYSKNRHYRDNVTIEEETNMKKQTNKKTNKTKIKKVNPIKSFFNKIISKIF